MGIGYIEGETEMTELFIKQKVFSLREKFTVKNQQEQDVYYVEGSFMRIPKTFAIMNTADEEVALITKKVFSFLPKFLWRWTAGRCSRLRRSSLS